MIISCQMARSELLTYTSDLSGNRRCELQVYVSQGNAYASHGDRKSAVMDYLCLQWPDALKLLPLVNKNLDDLLVPLFAYAQALMLGQPMKGNDDDQLPCIAPNHADGHDLRTDRDQEHLKYFVWHFNDVDLANLISVLDQCRQELSQRLSLPMIDELPFPPRVLAAELAQDESEALVSRRAAAVLAMARLNLRRVDAEGMVNELMDTGEQHRSEFNTLTSAIQQLDQDEMTALPLTQRGAKKGFPFGNKKSPTIIIPVNHGWLLENEGSWQEKAERIDVEGYRETLAAGIELTMLKMPAGTYRMGSAMREDVYFQAELPQQTIDLDEFHLGQSPVTQAQWELVSGWPKERIDLPRNPSRFKGMDRPVEQVSWQEAMEFCLRLQRHTSREYTLPCEEQWEYACRAGTTTPFGFGMTLTTAMANYDGNYFYHGAPKGLDRQETTVVNSFPANRWGLHDMHGNVWEWCVDRGEQGETRMIRGGSWGDGPGYCRSAIRANISQSFRGPNIGLRLCVPPQGYSAQRRRKRLQELLIQQHGASCQLEQKLAEAEEWRSEIQRLQEYTFDVSSQEPSTTPSQPTAAMEWRDSLGQTPALVHLTTTSAHYVPEKDRGQITREPIRVVGIKEELDLGFSITMLKIPAGEFMMGTEEEDVINSIHKSHDRDAQPRHRVQLESFFLGQYPVTQSQWKIVAGWPKVKCDLNPSPSRFCAPNRPVEQVSWIEAMEFCQRLSQKTQRDYTLPSEAQWEYACRAGTTTSFAFGETLVPELANYALSNPDQAIFFILGLDDDALKTISLTGLTDSLREETSQVGSFPSNSWGLHDMHGNVFEWCFDHWHPDYNGAPTDGRAWIEGGDESLRAQRGGCWNYGYQYACSASRNWRHRGVVDQNVGFRLCLASL